MPSELTPDDAVRAIQAMTRVLETSLERLTALATSSERWAVRSERWMRWQCGVLAVLLVALGVTFGIGVWTHATQNAALRQALQDHQAIVERLAR